jgi:hypothetical protein
MSGPTIPLRLDHQQRASLLAHLLTYLFSRIAKPATTRQTRIIEAVHTVTYQLLHLPEEDGQTVVPLNRLEAQSVRYALTILKPLYEEWPDEPDAPIALAHLAACFSLMEQAEQQARARAGYQECKKLAGELFRE